MLPINDWIDTNDAAFAAFCDRISTMHSSVTVIPLARSASGCTSTVLLATDALEVNIETPDIVTAEAVVSSARKENNRYACADMSSVDTEFDQEEREALIKIHGFFYRHRNVIMSNLELEVRQLYVADYLFFSNAFDNVCCCLKSKVLRGG